jgi:2-polyprenyl-3-methyl-5-hydroxy-6-metoxy-1,4-benzoquinol methylase
MLHFSSSYDSFASKYMTMKMSELKSSRYQVTGLYDRFSGTRIFVDEARKYRTVLECGCSTGFVSSLISSNGGPQVVGLELDEKAAELARTACTDVLIADLNKPGWAAQIKRSFDLITFGDVLEHLVDPALTLCEAKALLNPGGRVLISLPNIAHWSIRVKLLFGIFEYKSTGLMDYTHLRFFSVVTGRRMIETSGYKIVFFHPVVGGKFTSRFRSAWQVLTNLFPNLLAFQILLLAEPV